MILVTGGAGFIGRNLRVALGEREGFEVMPITRASSEADLADAVAGADAVIHLAGVNRPQDPAEFAAVNADFTARLCALLAACQATTPPGVDAGPTSAPSAATAEPAAGAASAAGSASGTASPAATSQPRAAPASEASATARTSPPTTSTTAVPGRRPTPNIRASTGKSCRASVRGGWPPTLRDLTFQLTRR